MMKVYFDCVCGKKIEVLTAEGFTSSAVCGVCGRSGVCTVKKKELFFQSDEMTMKEFESLGMKKAKVGGLSGSWVKTGDWTSSE